jgi:hypothetical protein
LDDLIIGAFGADPSGESTAGKSYVVKFIGICPFYAISNTFICITTIKVGCLSIINSSRNRGVDININCSGQLPLLLLMLQAIRQSNPLLLSTTIRKVFLPISETLPTAI